MPKMQSYGGDEDYDQKRTQMAEAFGDEDDGGEHGLGIGPKSGKPRALVEVEQGDADAAADALREILSDEGQDRDTIMDRIAREVVEPYLGAAEQDDAEQVEGGLQESTRRRKPSPLSLVWFTHALTGEIPPRTRMGLMEAKKKASANDAFIARITRKG